MKNSINATEDGMTKQSSEKRDEILSFEQLMIGMPFSKSQVDRMVQWKLEGDEVFFKKCFGPEPTDAKKLERMFLEDKDIINDEGCRIVKPMEREIAYHEQTNGIVVTFLAVRCKVKQA